jgi:hypothetical protein
MARLSLSYLSSNATKMRDNFGREKGVFEVDGTTLPPNAQGINNPV